MGEARARDALIDPRAKGIDSGTRKLSLRVQKLDAGRAANLAELTSDPVGIFRRLESTARGADRKVGFAHRGVGARHFGTEAVEKGRTLGFE